jgi:hypothetical protein
MSGQSEGTGHPVANILHELKTEVLDAVEAEVGKFVTDHKSEVLAIVEGALAKAALGALGKFGIAAVL